MVYKPFHGNGTRSDNLTHQVWFVEYSDIHGRDAVYDTAESKVAVETLRVSDGLICGDAIAMTEFSTKFEKLLNDIVQIKVDAGEAKSETKVLSARLNGTVERMNIHLDEASKRQHMLDKLWVTIVVQIITFAFFLGGVIWLVIHDSEQLKKLQDCQQRVMQHIIVDEARWDVFRIVPKEQ